MNHTYLPTLAAALFCAGIMVLLVLLFHLLRHLYSQRDSYWSHSKGRAVYIRSAVMLIGLVMVLAAQPIFWVSGQLRTYKIIRPGEPVCSLDIYTPGDRTPRLIYSTMGESNNELVEVIPVQDVGMRISGEIIEWPEWLAPLGLGTFFKLTGVQFVPGDQVDETVVTHSQSIHRGTTPVFQRLSGWPSKLSLARTWTLQTPVLDAALDRSYSVYVENGRLILE